MPLALVLILAVAPIPARPSAAPRITSHAAPADSYFGRSKMSALGIRNEIALLARRYRERTIADGDLLHDASIAQAAIDDWRRRFPRDPWVTPTAFHLEQLYAEVQRADARARATALLREIARDDPKSKEAHLSRLRLAEGFPSFEAETPPHATPNPYASANAETTPATASGAPAAVPTATASAAP